MKLFKKFRNFKKKVALCSEMTGSISYEDLIKITKKLKKTIPEKSFIFLISGNNIPSILSYIFSIQSNSIIMLIDINTKKKDILNLLKKYKPEYLIAPTAISRIHKDFKYIKDFYNYSILKTSYRKNKNLNKNLSVLLPTSGSMGSAKFVRLSNQNLKSNTDAIIQYLKIKSKDRTITNMPVGYSYMLSIINTFLESGASIYITNQSILSKNFWKEYRKNKITSLSGVPYFYEILIKLGLNKIYTKSLKTLTQAGGKPSEKILIKLSNFSIEKKINIFFMYGQTEAAPRIAYLNWKKSKKKLGSVGKAISGTKIWLENENKIKINKPYKEGELIFKGKNVFMGYAFNQKDLIKGDLNAGILRTGDIAYFDKDGYFYITGRKNRLVKIVGNRLNLDEIEQRMKKKNFEVACIEIKEKVFIFFEKKYNPKKVLNKITNITNQNEINFNCIKIKKFPLTRSKKINYSKLKLNA